MKSIDYDHYKEFLLHHLKLNPRNVDKTVNGTKHLINGYIITPDSGHTHIQFTDHKGLDISQLVKNKKQLLESYKKQFPKITKDKEDKSQAYDRQNGWKLSHPLRKLALYVEFMGQMDNECPIDRNKQPGEGERITVKSMNISKTWHNKSSTSSNKEDIIRNTFMTEIMNNPECYKVHWTEYGMFKDQLSPYNSCRVDVALGLDNYIVFVECKGTNRWHDCMHAVGQLISYESLYKKHDNKHGSVKKIIVIPNEPCDSDIIHMAKENTINIWWPGESIMNALGLIE